MFDNSFFPAWLEERLIDDEIFGQAYDTVPDNRRALLKTTIARIHVLYGTPQVTWGRQEKHWRQGHVSIAETRPVDWSLLLVDSSYASGVRLVSTVMIPVLCGVEDVLVAFVGESSVAPECLAALELAGIETAVQLSKNQADELLSQMQADRSSGRVLVLGDCGAEATATCNVTRQSLKVWKEPVFSAIGLQNGKDFDKDLLSWAHPDWNLVEITVDELAESNNFAAVCCESDIVDEVPDTIPVSLGSGQEGCWIWPDLVPEWFLHRRFSLLSEV